MTYVMQILSRIESGDPSAAEQLLPQTYDELRQLAACWEKFLADSGHYLELPGRELPLRPLATPSFGSAF